ncbi:MAG TPA: PepSY domain-containing protein [Burkholderiaceae bacterium]|jgi:hypothetical protein|nr:PepSY domain-containing protein [Burkholderiaceae bacterium]
MPISHPLPPAAVLVLTLAASVGVHAQAQSVKTADKPGASLNDPAFSRQGEQAACTTAPREEWLSLAEFELVARHRGYRPRVLKQTYGACYEIYGYDKQGNLVEAYFSPVNAKLVRSNVVTVRPGVPAGDK